MKTVEDVRAELERIAFYDAKSHVKKLTKNGVELQDLEKIDGQAISGLNTKVNGKEKYVEVKTHDKMKALELLGKHFKMYTDKIEHDGGIDFKLIRFPAKKEVGEPLDGSE
jgi:phage terminase small subunit